MKGVGNTQAFTINFFLLLSEPCRPWIEPGPLRQKFLSLSAEAHPDRAHQASESARRSAHERYTNLNAAYSCLRDPKDRLRHLLELELGAKPKQIEQIPPELMDRFLEVSDACRAADGFLAEKSATTSPLLKAQLFERNQAHLDQLTGLLKRVQSWNEAAVEELKAIDGEWIQRGEPAARQPLLDRLEALYRLFSYFGRWSAQLQERIVRLSI